MLSFNAEHLTGLSHQSQNKTAGFFTQLYQGQATRTRTPLATLYDDIRSVLRSSSDRDIHNIAIESSPPRDLLESARKFFRDIFPLAYLNFAKLEAKQFTPEYEACLKDAYDAVQPFGDVPRQVSLKSHHLRPPIGGTTLKLILCFFSIVGSIIIAVS